MLKWSARERGPAKSIDGWQEAREPEQCLSNKNRPDYRVATVVYERWRQFVVGNGDRYCSPASDSR